jgi:SP family general alpha glucoside:H+ symporter-like MFS transporter
MADPLKHSSEPETVVVEDNKTDAYDFDTNGLLKSTFDELSILRTLWVFKRVILVSLAVYTGYICEGFEVSEDFSPCACIQG